MYQKEMIQLVIDLLGSLIETRHSMNQKMKYNYKSFLGISGKTNNDLNADILTETFGIFLVISKFRMKHIGF